MELYSFFDYEKRCIEVVSESNTGTCKSAELSKGSFPEHFGNKISIYCINEISMKLANYRFSKKITGSVRIINNQQSSSHTIKNFSA